MGGHNINGFPGYNGYNYGGSTGHGGGRYSAGPQEQGQAQGLAYTAGVNAHAQVKLMKHEEALL